MRVLAPAFAICVCGCAATTNAPSLSPRPAEAIDPRVPVPEPAVSMTPAPALVEQLDRLVAQAVAGDAAFQPLLAHAGDLAGSAGAKESESWILAEQALSAAVSARGPVAGAAGDIDALAAARVQQLGGIAAGDMMAIDTARAKVGAIDQREAQAIDNIQRQLAR